QSQSQEVSRTILRRFLEADAGRSPLVLVFEDVHLAPSETIELVHHLVDEIEGAPVMVLSPARPELAARHPTWWESSGPTDHLKLDLGPLPREDAEELAAALLVRC